MSDARKIRDFLAMAIRHASRYGRSIEAPAQALFGAVFWFKDEEEVVTLKEMKNAVWVKVRGKSYAICYDAEEQVLEVREKTTQGHRLHAFKERTTASEIWRAFKGL